MGLFYSLPLAILRYISIINSFRKDYYGQQGARVLRNWEFVLFFFFYCCPSFKCVFNFFWNILPLFLIRWWPVVEGYRPVSIDHLGTVPFLSLWASRSQPATDGGYFKGVLGRRSFNLANNGIIGYSYCRIHFSWDPAVCHSHLVSKVNISGKIWKIWFVLPNW